MKTSDKSYKTLLFLILLFCSGIATISDTLAQSPVTVDYTLTTDPDAQSNKKFPLRPNFFRWVGQQTFDVYSDAITNPNSIYSPYYQDGNPVVNVHYEFKDYKIEDGWELIREEFGYEYDNNNGNRTQRPQPQTNPYIVFYNKYTGTIRVFAAIGELQNGYSSASLMLTYGATSPKGFKTNNFHEATQIKPLVALDQVPNSNGVGVPQIVAVSEFSNTRRQWFWADFTAIYDPCACLHKSLIMIELKLIDDAKVEFETDGELIEKTTTGGSDVRQNAGYVSLGYSDLYSGAKKAIEQFKSVNDFTSKEKDAIDKYRTAKKLSLENAEVAIPALTELGKIINSSSTLFTLLKAAPLIGAGITLMDMFISGGARSAITAPKVMRSTSKSNGHINASHLYQGIFFGNPGGENSDFEDERKPYYNNILGVFNILRTPKLNYNVQTEITVPDASGDCHYRDNTDIYKYRINEDIRYVINPATGLKWESSEDVEIVAALVIEFDNLRYNNDDNTSPFLKAVNHDYLYKYSSPNAFMVEEGPGAYRTQYVPLGCLKDVYAEFELRRFRTLERYNCEYNVWNPPYGVEVAPTIYPSRFYVKLIVNLKKKDPTPTSTNALYIGKYFAQLGQEKTNSTDWETNSWFSIPRNVTLNTAITSSQTIRAWNKITISPGFSLSNGATLNAIAGKEIVVDPELDIPPDATLETGIPVECNTTIQPLTSSELSTFCTGNQYNPDIRDFAKESGGLAGISPTESWVNAMPNPSNGQTVLQYSISEPGFVQLSVTDALGQQIATLVDNTDHPKGTYEVRFGSPELPSGVYYYTLRTGTFVQTKKLLLIK